MRRSFLFAGAAALLLASCSPQTFTLGVDMIYPSKSGINLARKTVSVVYMDDGQADSTFSNGVVSSLARNLEENYFGGDEAVGMYKIPSDSVTLDLMHRLVMDSGDDVIFLLDRPSFGEVALGDNVQVKNARSVDSAFVAYAQIPYNAKLYVYDSMDKSDKVSTFRGSSILRVPVYNNGVTPKEFLSKQALERKDRSAEMVGSQMFNRFAPVWKTEGYSIYFYDDWKGEWIDALNHAYLLDWHKAAEKWMKMFPGLKGDEKKACACYNTALAFYMLGDLDIATKWLDRADSLASLSLSPGLRSRIQSRR